MNKTENVPQPDEAWGVFDIVYLLDERMFNTTGIYKPDQSSVSLMMFQRASALQPHRYTRFGYVNYDMLRLLLHQLFQRNANVDLTFSPD